MKWRCERCGKPIEIEIGETCGKSYLCEACINKKLADERYGSAVAWAFIGAVLMTILYFLLR